MGGGQTLLLRTIAAMDADRFAHIVCATRPGGPMAARFEAVGARTFCLGMRRDALAPLAAVRLGRLARQERVDLLHTNNTPSDRIPAQLTALALRLPTVNTLHTFALPPRRPASLGQALRTAPRRTRWALELWLMGRTVAWTIAVSAHGLRSWRPWLERAGLAQERCSVAPPGVDVERFSGVGADEVEQLRRELGLARDAKIVVNVARFDPGKGQETLVRALPKLLRGGGRVAMVFVGDGPTRPAVEQLARKLGALDAVRFAGFREDVQRCLALADVVAFPSVREGFGLAILEAMAAGRPLVVYDLPTLGEIPGAAQAAAVAPMGDEAAFADNLRDLLNDPQRCRAMGRAGRSIAAGFSTRRTAEAVAAIYERVIRGATGAVRGGAAA